MAAASRRPWRREDGDVRKERGGKAGRHGDWVDVASRPPGLLFNGAAAAGERAELRYNLT
jgi:hypothetical protein